MASTLDRNVFDINKEYTITVTRPNGQIVKDKHGFFEDIVVRNIRYNSNNGVYSCIDENGTKRVFTRLMTIDYFENW